MKTVFLFNAYDILIDTNDRKKAHAQIMRLVDETLTKVAVSRYGGTVTLEERQIETKKFSSEEAETPVPRRRKRGRPRKNEVREVDQD